MNSKIHITLEANKTPTGDPNWAVVVAVEIEDTTPFHAAQLATETYRQTLRRLQNPNIDKED